ncbi:MAG: hypothetical protein LBH94_05025 [Deltaproteobacteria bacterium]|nr:hypothetical protein [Deltaproteobacteria bacterium]
MIDQTRMGLGAGVSATPRHSIDDRDAGAAAPRRGALSSTPSRAEAEGKRDEFREAVRQDAGKDKPGSEGEKDDLKMVSRDEQSEVAMPPPFSGDALLRGLGASFAPLETLTATPVLTRDAAALATELAERILVNANNRAGVEVRISLKDSVLPDVEIILRQDGERLVVRLVGGNPASLDVLRLSQNELRDKLLALGRDISVEVQDSRNMEAGDNGHSDRRSRGLDYFTESEG